VFLSQTLPTFQITNLFETLNPLILIDTACLLEEVVLAVTTQFQTVRLMKRKDTVLAPVALEQVNSVSFVLFLELRKRVVWQYGLLLFYKSCLLINSIFTRAAVLVTKVTVIRSAELQKIKNLHF
jgi:hypothetical protein